MLIIIIASVGVVLETKKFIKVRMNLCRYKHVFGKEGEGVHSIRLFRIAIVDLGFTIFAAYFISIYMKIPFSIILLILLLLGIIAHRVFCVNTTVNTLIFGVV